MPFTIHLHAGPDGIAAAEWDALLERQAAPTPFMRHAFLSALVTSGCASTRTGWAPRWVTVHDDDGHLAAAAPAWIKAHSYGEYVFDWAWADAYRRHGLRYWPKLLVAVPFVAAEGTRLMARDKDARAALVAALDALVVQRSLSSAHVLFHDAVDAAALQAAGWRGRDGWQYHWHQGSPRWADWAGMLAAMTRDKRKKIQQDERRVRDAGIGYEVLEGAAIDADAWGHFVACYERTYDEHGSTPYLDLGCFLAWARAQPDDWVMFVAREDGGAGARVAASLVTVDRARRAAWGRWWGTLRDVPGLHFDACYHQPLRWCLAHGIDRFEGGAQGEHKIARGLLPAPTQSSHRIVHPAFDEAIAQALARERDAVARTVAELATHTPFKPGGTAGD